MSSPSTLSPSPSPLLQTCLSFCLSHLPPSPTSSPIIIGLNGIQGSGKTTLASALSHHLTSSHSLSVLVLSIDDFYLPHTSQLVLANTLPPETKLLKHRGQPGTHSIDLLLNVLRSVLNGCKTQVPRYDKSAFSGQGDRLPVGEWDVVNVMSSSSSSRDVAKKEEEEDEEEEGRGKIQVVLLEGWCVGFKPIRSDELEARWKGESRSLKKYRLDDLLLVNEKLMQYDTVTAMLDGFIHLDAEELEWVYEWRLQQEHMLIAEKGSGMSDDEVERFVDGYYPSYELYYEAVRKGVFVDKPGRQLRVVVDRDRGMKKSVEI